MHWAYLIKQNIIYQEKQGNGKRVTEMLEILHKYSFLLFIHFQYRFFVLDYILMIQIYYRN